MWSLFPHNCCVPWGFCKWTDTIEAGCFWCQRQRKRRGILTLLLAVYLYLIHDLVWRWKMVSVSVCDLFHQPMDEKIKHWLFVFRPRKTLNGGGIVWLANHVAVWRQSKVSIDFKKVLRHKVFSPEHSLSQPKSHARLYPFNKPVNCSIS